LKEIVAAAISALLTAIAGYFLARRQVNRQRQEEQCWIIYLGLRSLEDLTSPRFDKHPEQEWLKLFEQQRAIIFRNLIRSNLPQTEEVIRALNPVTWSLDYSKLSPELHRLSVAVLRHLDPRYAGLYERLQKEWSPLKEGQTLEEYFKAKRKKAP
jgi:hypothetical protein